MAARRKWSDQHRAAIWRLHRRGLNATEIADRCKGGEAGVPAFDIPRRTIGDIIDAMTRTGEGHALTRPEGRSRDYCTCEEPAPDPDELLVPPPQDLPRGEVRKVPCQRCGQPLSIFHLITLDAEQVRARATPSPATS